MEECKEVGVERFDLTKVIDSVPHRQLIQTSGLNICALKSYTGRMQNVVLKCSFFAAISSIVRIPPRICPGAHFFSLCGYMYMWCRYFQWIQDESVCRSILSVPYEWFDLVKECKEVGAELLI